MKIAFIYLAIVAITTNSCAQQNRIPVLCEDTMALDDARDGINDGDMTLITDSLSKKSLLFLNKVSTILFMCIWMKKFSLIKK